MEYLSHKHFCCHSSLSHITQWDTTYTNTRTHACAHMCACTSQRSVPEQPFVPACKARRTKEERQSRFHSCFSKSDVTKWKETSWHHTAPAEHTCTPHCERAPGWACVCRSEVGHFEPLKLDHNVVVHRNIISGQACVCLSCKQKCS